MAEKRVTFTNDYNKRRGPSHGYGQFTYGNTGNRHQAGRDITDTQQSTYDGAHSSTHEVIGVILPEPTHLTLVVDDRSIGNRISSLAGMMTMIARTALLEPRREEPGRTMGGIHVLLLVRDEIHNQVDSISPRGLVHLIIRYSNDPTAKNSAVLSRMNSALRERMTNLALTQCDLPQRTIQSMHYPTFAR